MSQIRPHNIPLIHHHARGKHSKQDCFHNESQHVHEIAWLIQTLNMMMWLTTSRSPLHANDKARNDQHHAIHTRQKRVKDKQQEILVIANAHTIVDPRTVMIEPLNAIITDATMRRPRCSENLAGSCNIRDAG